MLASRLFRSCFVILPMIAAAWAAGCSDDDKVAAAADAGTDGAVVTQPSDAGNQPSACGNDLDPDGLFKHLSCTGLYSDATTKTVATSAVAYKPAVEFWSDGAEKSRWLSLPPNTKIDTSNMDEWKFPAGTKVWKQFKLQGKLIETRLFMKADDGTWNHTTYRWSDDESDAMRLEGGEAIPGIGPDGGTYQVPTTSDCQDCHGGRVDSLLGVDAISLGLPGATGETLAQLVTDNRLSNPPSSTSLTLPPASAAQGGDRAGPALSWLHTNCGACHNANTNANATFTQLFLLLHATDLLGADGGAPLTIDQLDAYKLTYCQDSHRPEPDAGLNDAGAPLTYKFVRPSLPTRSLVSVLSGHRSPMPDTDQMPPIVSRAVDVTGHQELDDWITALQGTCP